LRVTVVPPPESWNSSDQITLKTSSPRRPVITTTAYAIVMPALVVTPKQIVVPKGPLTNAVPFTVKVESYSTNKLVLSEPAITAPGVKVHLREVEPGHVFELAGSFPAGFLSQRWESFEVRVKSNFPQFPEVKVPVFQIFTTPQLERAAAA